MRSPSTDLEAECWAFALAIYARLGVAEACLTLQDEAGVDVMLLLTTTFAAVKHRLLLTSDEIRALDEACRPWREQIVWPLRAIRSGLKTGPRPAPSEASKPFRSQVKALELAAEKLQNKLLVECLPLRPPEEETVRPEQLRTVLENVVSRFAKGRGAAPKVNLASSIDTIVDAAIPAAS
ncbi:TIGR02444 family protein [Bradyrhizobium sp.]|jgi:uncharacterized protein (TIGR02444 family)|uniref:TIGR02444 family protein n=1 Tax=Bradyrhizobium sp. TaxID=376 RepID=UPI003C1EDB11